MRSSAVAAKTSPTRKPTHATFRSASSTLARKAGCGIVVMDSASDPAQTICVATATSNRRPTPLPRLRTVSSTARANHASAARA